MEDMHVIYFTQSFTEGESQWVVCCRMCWSFGVSRGTGNSGSAAPFSGEVNYKLS